MNANLDVFVDLSEVELEALADSWLAPSTQARFDTLVAQNKERPLSAGEEAELDNHLKKIDQLTILKNRARLTLIRKNSWA